MKNQNYFIAFITMTLFFSACTKESNITTTGVQNSASYVINYPKSAKIGDIIAISLDKGASAPNPIDALPSIVFEINKFPLKVDLFLKGYNGDWISIASGELTDLNSSFNTHYRMPSPLSSEIGINFKLIVQPQEGGNAEERKFNIHPSHE